LPGRSPRSSSCIRPNLRGIKQRREPRLERVVPAFAGTTMRDRVFLNGIVSFLAR
jgi:hypothetical protein